MGECQHCNTLAVEVAAIRVVVERLEHTLLGNHQPGKCAQHEERVGRLERWRAWLTGALAVVGFLYAAALTALGAIIAAKMRHG